MRAILLLVSLLLVCCSSDFSSSTSETDASTTTTGGSNASTTTTGGSSSSTTTTGGAAPTVARILSLGSSGASSGTSIHTEVYLCNVSQSDFNLAEFELRYWFTAELATGASLVADVGSGLFSQRVSIGTVVPPRKGADHYIGITFEYGTIIASAKEKVSFEAHQANWAAFDQSDDYSYPGDIANGEELVTVGVYRNGLLIAGVEPPQ